MDRATFERLDDSLVQALNKVNDLEQKFATPGGAQSAVHGLNELVGLLAAVRSASEGVTLEIPEEMLKAIDQGLHPETVTYDAFQRSQFANQESKGRIDAIRHLRDALIKEAFDQYPDSAADYLRTIGTDPREYHAAHEARTTGENPGLAHGQGGAADAGGAGAAAAAAAAAGGRKG